MPGGRTGRATAGRRATSSVKSWILGNAAPCWVRSAFRYFSAPCCAWKQTVSHGTWEAVRLLSILRRSCSAFSTHRRTISGLLGGPVIEDLPFTQCGCDHGAGNVTVLHAILRRHHDQVLRNAHSSKQSM